MRFVNSRSRPFDGPGMCLGILVLLCLVDLPGCSEPRPDSRASGGVTSAFPISWRAPLDGGTPRDSNRILRLGPGVFRILARAEEGRSPLTHAVSRMDLLCVNEAPEEQKVTLLVNLSGDGGRTNFNENHFGEMPLRDFVYVQAPGRAWRRVDGRTSGWECALSFAAAPGETRLGLSPWYTYGDYLRFMGRLADSPNFRKTPVGLSDGGRETWELRITDPSAPPDRKRRIFWHAREHAYESFSSYAMEGLVEFLLSDEAAEFRKRFDITLHPMTNVDGVASGYEYRGGYDYPEPRRTATAKLTWGAVDRLRPHLVVSWHNWIAPRAVDVLFFTDEEGGKPSRRAWDLFTQRFPSPRGVGHRWSNETDPLRHNWFGRTLSDDNVHQYARKHYGSQVWGWEMPWWGRDAGDPTENARKHGADFGRAFLSVQTLLEAPQERDSPAQPLVEVNLGQAHQFFARGTCRVLNPARDAAVVGEFASPSGKKRLIEGVYEGEKGWRLAFLPDEEGDWTYLLRGEGVEYLVRGRLRCIKAP